MAPDMSPERYADKMSAEQQLCNHTWPNDDHFVRAITWACALVWCALAWLGLAWWFDLLPDWSWL